MMPSRMRIGEAARRMGLSTKTLKRAGQDGVLIFGRDRRHFRWITSEELVHAPLFSLQQTADRLGLRRRTFLTLFRSSRPLSTFAELRTHRVFWYFSFTAIEEMKRESPRWERLVVRYKFDNVHWKHGKRVFARYRHIHADVDTRDHGA